MPVFRQSQLSRRPGTFDRIVIPFPREERAEKTPEPIDPDILSRDLTDPHPLRRKTKIALVIPWII
jgi:hypothetical protein